MSNMSRKNNHRIVIASLQTLPCQYLQLLSLYRFLSACYLYDFNLTKRIIVDKLQGVRMRISMMTFFLTILVSLNITGCNSSSDDSTPPTPPPVEVNLTVPAEKYPVASAPFVIDNSKIDPNINYWTGEEINGTRYSVANIIQNNSETIVFPVTIPDDAIYGSVRSQTMHFAAYLLYPTSWDNDDPDIDYGYGLVFPKMRQAGENPKFPDAAEKYPLIVFSHGYGDHPGSNIEFLEEYAKRGYIVLAIWHGDHMFDEDSPEQLAMRPLEMKYAIDYILNDPIYASHIDENKIAAMGQSFGGLSVAGLVGAKLMNFERSYAEHRVIMMDVQTDSKVKAAVGIVPWFGGSDTYNYSAAQSESVFSPFMAFAGEQDNDASYDLIFKNLKSMQSVDKYLIKFSKYGHDLVDETTAHDILAWSIPYLEAYLENNTSSKLLIQSATSAQGYADDKKDNLE